MILVEILGGLVIVFLIGLGIYALFKEAGKIVQDRKIHQSLDQLKRRMEDGNEPPSVPPSAA